MGFWWSPLAVGSFKVHSPINLHLAEWFHTWSETWECSRWRERWGQGSVEVISSFLTQVVSGGWHWCHWESERGNGIKEKGRWQWMGSLAERKVFDHGQIPGTNFRNPVEYSRKKLLSKNLPKLLLSMLWWRNTQNAAGCVCSSGHWSASKYTGIPLRGLWFHKNKHNGAFYAAELSQSKPDKPSWNPDSFKTLSVGRIWLSDGDLHDDAVVHGWVQRLPGDGFYWLLWTPLASPELQGNSCTFT